jgi:serine/threonine-protein kinase
MKTKFKSFGITLVMIFGVFVLGAALMNFVVMPLLIHQRGTVIVPDVRQMSEAQAEKFLSRASLEMTVERRDHHPDVPEGFVVSQRPRANESVKEGRSVGVVVSLGAKTLTVPDLKGQSLRQGELTLNSRKLRAGRVARVLDETDVRERVLASAPGSGAEVAEGALVDLLVEVGGRPRRYLMPDLIGEDVLFVRQTLEKKGFRIGAVRYESRSGAYPNTVVEQMPKPGAMIREGDSIELVAAGSN